MQLNYSFFRKQISTTRFSLFFPVLDAVIASNTVCSGVTGENDVYIPSIRVYLVMSKPAS